VPLIIYIVLLLFVCVLQLEEIIFLVHDFPTRADALKRTIIQMRGDWP